MDYKECVRCKVFKTSDLGSSACEQECARRNITKITTVDYVTAGWFSFFLFNPTPPSSFNNIYIQSSFNTWRHNNSKQYIQSCGVTVFIWILMTIFLLQGARERCVAADKDDCSFVFTFRTNNVTEEVELLVQKERSKSN